MSARAGQGVALTFDDGPDPEWTPQILDILKAKHVHATFFMIGANAEANPGLVQRILAEGHEVGNHTYTHPNLADTPDQAVALELNATQRLFEALTGRSHAAVPAALSGRRRAGDAGEIVPVEIAQSLGYITVGEHVDPVDWALPGADVIVQRALDADRTAPARNCAARILLHDAGGDRSQTVAALPILIDQLRAEGYRFVPVSELAGLTRDQAMPPLPPTHRAVHRPRGVPDAELARARFSTMLPRRDLAWRRAAASFSPPGLWNARREAAHSGAPRRRDTHPRLGDRPRLQRRESHRHHRRADSGKRLSRSGSHRDRRRLAGPHRPMSCTAVSATIRGSSLIRIPNGGKANALNVGLAHARGEIVVALDADTQFQTRHHLAPGALVRRSGESAPWRATPRSATAST